MGHISLLICLSFRLYSGLGTVRWLNLLICVLVYDLGSHSSLRVLETRFDAFGSKLLPG